MSVFTSFGNSTGATVNVDLVGSSTPTVSTVSLATAGTEYSFVLPINCREYRLKFRNSDATLQLSFVAGASGTTFLTVPRYCEYGDSDMKLTSTVTLYFQSNKNSQVLEILTWV